MIKEELKWKPITEHFGAEIDIDLSQKLSDSQKEQIAKLFDERHLLVFHDQVIDYETQREVAGICGNVLPPEGDAKYLSTVHDMHGNPIENPRDLDSRTEMFHIDMMFLPNHPVHAICLYAEDVTDSKAGTRFISLGDRLSEEDRAQLHGRTAIQQHGLKLPVEETLRLRQFPFDDVKDKFDFWSEHPLLLPHPRTGVEYLYYTPIHTHSIVGMTPEESLEWFAKFDALLYNEADMYTHKWVKNDLVIWDNFALQHAREHIDPSIKLPTRVLRRVALGPVPYDTYGATSYGDLDPREIVTAH